MSDSDSDDNKDDDLFGDSDDTAELIASASKNKAAPAKKKTTAAPPKKKIRKDDKPDADNDSDSDGDDDKGLFDSDSDSDSPQKKKAKTVTKKTPAAPAAKSMSKKERLEALANRHRKEESDPQPKKKNKSDDGSKRKQKDDSGEKKKDSGYDSGDSYDSGDFQRTAEDDDFIDTTGEDADAVQELYAEQHFDDDRPDGLSSKKKKKKRAVRYDSDDDRDNPDRVRVNKDDVEPDNPIMAAVYRMKKKKADKKPLSELEEEIKIFLTRMEMAAEEDEQLIAEKKPATRKLAMLNEVCDYLTKRDMQRMLLDFDLLSVCKRWIQPLPNGTLGNVTVRQRLLEVIGNMTGETGITASDLKRSEFGKVVMILFKHRNETPTMKQKLKVLIEQWSRPIFQKSGNMRDLNRVSRGDTGLSALARQQFIAEQQASKQQQFRGSASGGGSNNNSNHPSSVGRSPDDLHALITGSSTGGKKLEAGVNRVRVPYSKGFAFQVQPNTRVEHGEKGSRGSGKGGSTGGGAGGGVASGDNRSKLVRRMQEKGKTVSKNQRSANISVEGRATKG